MIDFSTAGGQKSDKKPRIAENLLRNTDMMEEAEIDASKLSCVIGENSNSKSTAACSPHSQLLSLTVQNLIARMKQEILSRKGTDDGIFEFHHVRWIFAGDEPLKDEEKKADHGDLTLGLVVNTPEQVFQDQMASIMSGSCKKLAWRGAEVREHFRMVWKNEAHFLKKIFPMLDVKVIFRVLIIVTTVCVFSFIVYSVNITSFVNSSLVYECNLLTYCAVCFLQLIRMNSLQDEEHCPLDVLFCEMVLVVPTKFRPIRIFKGDIFEHPQSTNLRKLLEATETIRALRLVLSGNKDKALSVRF